MFNDCLVKTTGSAKEMLTILLSQWIMFGRVRKRVAKVIPAVNITVKM